MNLPTFEEFPTLDELKKHGKSWKNFSKANNVFDKIILPKLEFASKLLEKKEIERSREEKKYLLALNKWSDNILHNIAFEKFDKFGPIMEEVMKAKFKCPYGDSDHFFFEECCKIAIAQGYYEEKFEEFDYYPIIKLIGDKSYNDAFYFCSSMYRIHDALKETLPNIKDDKSKSSVMHKYELDELGEMIEDD